MIAMERVERELDRLGMEGNARMHGSLPSRRRAPSNAFLCSLAGTFTFTFTFTPGQSHQLRPRQHRPLQFLTPIGGRASPLQECKEQGSPAILPSFLSSSSDGGSLHGCKKTSKIKQPYQESNEKERRWEGKGLPASSTSFPSSIGGRASPLQERKEQGPARDPLRKKPLAVLRRVVGREGLRMRDEEPYL